MLDIADCPDHILNLEREEREAARLLLKYEQNDDGSTLSAARIASAAARHARAEAALGEAILLASVDALLAGEPGRAA